MVSSVLLGCSGWCYSVASCQLVGLLGCSAGCYFFGCNSVLERLL